MRSQPRRATRIARTMSVLALLVALSATTSRPVAADADSGGLYLLGDPAIIDTNIGQGSGDKLEHYTAVTRIFSSFKVLKDVTVEFTVHQGATTKVQTAKAGIRGGGGVVTSDFVLPKKGTRTVEVRFRSWTVADILEDSKALTAARFVGKPKFLPSQGFGPHACSMGGRVTNPSSEPLHDADVYFIALKGGKLVAVGYDHLFDDVKPGATIKSKVDFITCQKVGVVLAYVEGDGGFP